MRISKKNLKCLIENLLKEDLNHTIQSGETASGIAQRYNITLTQLKDANSDIANLDNIRAGDVLTIPSRDNEGELGASIDRNLQRDNIPQPAEDDDYTDEEKTVACTLLAEVGSTISDATERIQKMTNVYTVIHNRARDGKWNTGPISMEEIVLESDGGVYQFSCWSEDPNMDDNDLPSTWRHWETERPERWQEALDVVRSGQVSADVGDSKYYYAPSQYAPFTSHPIPDFAAPNRSDGDPCWEEIHDDESHKFGKSGRPWNNCTWYWRGDRVGGERMINPRDGTGHHRRPAPQ
jgi:LysM repeat protein